MTTLSARSPLPLPLNQIAFSVVDLRRTEAWWCDGLGFLPAGGSRLMMRGPLSASIVDLPGAAMTCRCLVGRNDWCQLELFQYERPMARLMPADRQPNDIGYSRMGVWVADFDLALARLAELGTQPLTAPLGRAGAHRVCVRNPDGVYVELLEQDPLPEENLRGRQDRPVAIRYVSMTTPDLAASSAFVGSGLGVPEHDLQLHDDAHEALWGLADAGARRRVFGGPTLLLEIVEYGRDPGRCREAGYRINDQGILNICFGDPRNRHGVNAMYQRAPRRTAGRSNRGIGETSGRLRGAQLGVFAFDVASAENTDHGRTVGTHGRLDPTMQCVVAVERHPREQVVYGMQVLAEPEPLQWSHPPRHDQAVGVPVTSGVCVRMVRAIREPVRDEECTGQVAEYQQYPGMFSRNQRNERDPPADREQHFRNVGRLYPSWRGCPVTAEQEGVLDPQKTKSANHEGEKSTAHAANDVVRILVRLVGVAMMGEMFDLVSRERHHDQRCD
jgi:catechol 2,3-dioxygenase-like lactoylglutathione lyase family enzyme